MKRWNLPKADYQRKQVFAVPPPAKPFSLTFFFRKENGSTKRNYFWVKPFFQKGSYGKEN